MKIIRYVYEDMFEDCPIYTEFVGIRKSTKMMCEGIFIRVIIVISIIVCFILLKIRTNPSSRLRIINFSSFFVTFYIDRPVYK